MGSSWTDSLNFPLILVLATFVTGVIWLLDAVLFAPKRARRAQATAVAAGPSTAQAPGQVPGEMPGEVPGQVPGQAPEQPILVEYARSFFPVLLVVLVLRSFFFEPFRIPSGSMIPTLLIGDYILVNKFAYGVRLPVVHTKVLDTGKPERGDVAVFRFPSDPRLDYIKRVVGLPGDTVTYADKTLYVNGDQVAITGGEAYVDPVSDALVSGATLRREQLGEVEHDILVFEQGFSGSRAYEVPEGHYFMVGDNRDKSNDSRFWGFVPEENLVGKARFIWMHWNGGILWSRLGETIR